MSTSELQAGNVRRSGPQPSISPTPSGHLSSKTPVKEIREELPAQPIPVYTALSLSRRRFILGIITVAGIFGPLAGNIYLPALPVIGRQFHRTEAEINITVTVFMIVFAFGVSLSRGIEIFTCVSKQNSSQPLVWSSFADWKGRRPLYIVSILVYILANVLLAAIPANYGALIVLRVVQALGSSAVVSLGAGTVADVRVTFWLRETARRANLQLADHRTKKTSPSNVILPFRSSMRSNPRPGDRRCYSR